MDFKTNMSIAMTYLDTLPVDLIYIIKQKLESPYTRDNFPQMLGGCTCDSGYDSRAENLKWCCQNIHVCVCEPEPYNFKNSECRAMYHNCVCHVINTYALHGSNYDHVDIDFTGDTYSQCRANKHHCLCHLGYHGGCPAHSSRPAI